MKLKLEIDLDNAGIYSDDSIAESIREEIVNHVSQRVYDDIRNQKQDMFLKIMTDEVRTKVADMLVPGIVKQMNDNKNSFDLEKMMEAAVMKVVKESLRKSKS